MNVEHTKLTKAGIKELAKQLPHCRIKSDLIVFGVNEVGTEGEAAKWSIEDFQGRQRSEQQTSRAEFQDDNVNSLAGNSALHVVIQPYAGFRAALTYPKARNAAWSMKGKAKLTFWMKAINESRVGWQGGPFITLHGDGESQCHLEPKDDRNLMREFHQNQTHDGWRFFEIPLKTNDRWQLDGELPTTVRALSIAVDSWEYPKLEVWIDGLSLE